MATLNLNDAKGIIAGLLPVHIVETIDQYDRIGQMTKTVVYDYTNNSASNTVPLCFGNPEIGTYKILPKLGCQLQMGSRMYEGDKVHEYIPTTHSKLGKSRSTAGSFYYIMEHVNSKGEVMATAKRPATSSDMPDIVEASKKTTEKILKDLSAVGLVRGYRHNGQTGYYVNPIYLAKTGSRNVTWICWLLFRDELVRFLSYNGEWTNSIAVREMDTIAYYHLCPDELAKLPRERDLAQQPEDNNEAAAANGMTTEDVASMDESDIVDQDDSLTRTPEEHDKILRELVYREQEPQIYGISKKRGAYKLRGTKDDEDNYFQPNHVQEDPDNLYPPTAASITSYNTWFCDIDAGTDRDGHYLPEDEVIERKAIMMHVLAALPPCTYATETRNGVQILWSAYGCDNIEDWTKVERRIIDIVSIADRKVTNVNRLVRVPGSMWVKADNEKNNGIAPYRCKCLEARYTMYPVDDMMTLLDQAELEIKRICAAYIEKYPDAEQPANTKKVGTKAAARKTITVAQGDKILARGQVNQYAITPRLQAIAALKPIPMDTTTVYTSNVAAACKMVDMTAFLDIDNPANFLDLFHVESTASATIYDNGQNGYRYVCSSTTSATDRSGWDLIDCVAWIADCSTKDAVRYIAKCCRIKYRKIA